MRLNALSTTIFGKKKWFAWSCTLCIKLINCQLALSRNSYHNTFVFQKSTWYKWHSALTLWIIFFNKTYFICDQKLLRFLYEEKKRMKDVYCFGRMWTRLAVKAMFYWTDCVVLTCTWCLDSLPTSQNWNQGWKNWPTLLGNIFVIR